MLQQQVSLSEIASRNRQLARCIPVAKHLMVACRCRSSLHHQRPANVHGEEVNPIQGAFNVSSSLIQLHHSPCCGRPWQQPQGWEPCGQPWLKPQPCGALPPVQGWACNKSAVSHCKVAVRQRLQAHPEAVEDIMR